MRHLCLCYPRRVHLLSASTSLRAATLSATLAALVALGAAGCDDAGDSGGAEGDSTGEQDTSGGDRDGSVGLDDTGASGLPSGFTQPGCTDGDYTEALPLVDADLAPVEAQFGTLATEDFVVAALAARYPNGASIVEMGSKEQLGGGQNCIDAFLSPTGSAQGIYGQLSTVVHECGHLLDIGLGGFSGAAYWITDEVEFTCANGSTAEFGGKTVARSLINGDEFSSQHPPCATFRGGSGCDSYAPIYLDGDPADNAFDSGDQGFDMLLEETVQYVNSLATGYAFADRYTGAVSERDGLLTFLWYLTRYLRLTRLEHPQAYSAIIDDPCWRDAILTVWGRAWLYLETTEGHPRLGINDVFLLSLVDTPSLLEEIERVRQAASCP